ncbi:MAG: DedA family protein [Chloroflexota bacterium]
MLALEQQILALVTAAYNALQWPGVVLLMAVESACIPVPSEIIMPLAGWMLVKAKALPVAYTLLAGFYGALGNLLGSLVAYAVGAWGGRPLLEKYGRYLLVSRRDLDLADSWFARRGSLAVFLGRLLPGVRTFISLPAGIARMNLVKFCIYTLLGAFIWSTGLAYGGYLMGEHWEQIREAMRPFDPLFVLLVVGLLALYIYRHVRHSREGA